MVVRRTAIEVRGKALVRERAERDGADLREAVLEHVVPAIIAAGETDVSVHLTDDGRPKSLPEEFFTVYGEALGDRKVSARLTHGEPRPDAEVHPWPLRFTDFDVLEHMNNAAYWSAVEEESRRRDRPPMLAEVEFRARPNRARRADPHMRQRRRVEMDGRRLDRAREWS